MAAYKTGAFVRSKYYTSFYKTPLKWIPRSKSGASKSRPRWAAHTCIGNVWDYPHPREWRAIQSWNCFKRFTKKRQNYNSDKLLSFVDEKISCALAYKTP